MDAAPRLDAPPAGPQELPADLTRALLAWAGGWSAMFWLDGRLDLANLALLLVLSSAVATLWLPGWLSAVASVLAVAAFNWAFVPPRHSFAVDLDQHALLLVSLLAVNAIVSALVVRQRRQAEAAHRMAARESRLRRWGDMLREADDPAALVGALQAALGEAAPQAVTVAVRQRLDAGPDDTSTLQAGEADDDQRAGLALCMREGRALGPGSGRHEEQPDLYLPLRGRGLTLGAALLHGGGRRRIDADLRPHLQALCDQLGTALQRASGEQQARRARELAQQQGVRNALLAAISHDYRTPLAAIMSAASALQEQAERLAPAQRRRLATAIVDEAEHLGRLTDNTLQLARLEAPGVVLCCDWESAEEIVGAVLRRARRRPQGERLRARLEPGLPLLWCDALRVSQLLENLADNALAYSPPAAPAEILVRRVDSQIMLAVRDRGPGIAPAWRERVFEVFQRGDEASRAQALEASRQGSGVGLAVCRAIARAHGGELKLRPRGHGGCAFEFLLPMRVAPPAAPPEDEAPSTPPAADATR
ncbi:Osmosensitive K+ channel histidine kinase KdpD [Rubrivivax sp. A210]|uniref:sensor histidine kinase n=1 Tax=Rubrivivax sp. A210 TaxID=2772301 RepID=UPI00191835EA|nr:ATP-binding protein [Rubrivivax sp. A210]CAD5374531.1 Osmosensitive K+ channel histidine kinase KdpD [Rubrivivax sp. A210]